MDLGIGLLTSGPHASPETILRMAQEAERLGFAALWTHERLLYPLEGSAQTGRPFKRLPSHYRTTYEPIDTLAFVAAATTEIKLGTSVLTGPLHNPVQLARRLATVDQFSRGRVVVGLGQGFLHQEYAAANVPFAQRGGRLEELIAALRAAWAPDPVWYQGRYYRIPLSDIDPKPHQVGGPPILVGATAPTAIDRAARIADGFNPIASSLDRLAADIQRFRTSAESAGRDPERLKIVVRAAIPLTRSPQLGERPLLGGSPAQVVMDLCRLKPLGVDHVLLTNLLQPPVNEQLALLGELKTAADHALIEDARI